MMYILELIVIVVSNFLFSISRTYSTRVISEGKIRQVVISSVIVKGLWLISTSLAVKSVLSLDLLPTMLYLISGVYGDYIAMKFKTDKIEKWVETLLIGGEENNQEKP